MKYAKVVIENKSRFTDTLFTYKVPEDWNIGDVITVPFGRGNKEKRGYLVDMEEGTELSDEIIKEAIEKDTTISLSKEMVETALWMRERYGVSYLEAIKPFVPPGKPTKEGKEKRPLKERKGERIQIDSLTLEQEAALKEIHKALESGKQQNLLIHGVTGSGKTEIYMQAARKALDMGKTAIILVPEIALTKQITERLIGRFGEDKLAILHSSLTGRERFDEWVRIRKGEAKVVIGARMAIFAPVENLGLVVMDEEHESTYKSDMSPKYETVDLAVKRLSNSKGILIAGSATPSVVSYQRAKEGIYKLIKLENRYNSVKLPKIQIVDMREELKQGNSKAFSNELYQAMKEELAEKRQTILFLNRRGYANYITCNTCGNTLTCPDCGISLTYHKRENAGVCHYCGRKFPVPKNCQACGSKYIRFIGLGTEQLEEQTKEIFPEAKVDRLDLDTAKGGRQIGRILNDFAEGKTDILIGTQLVAKGLDFRNVGLVGVAMADTTLNIPDYRSQERTFQLITQVAGRAGRGDREGKVIVQTLEPDNEAIKAAANYDYEKFFRNEILFREMMNYPPFTNIVVVEALSKNHDKALWAINQWDGYIKKKMPEEGGPEIFKPKLSDTPVQGSSGFRYYSMIKCGREHRNQLIYQVMRFRRALLEKERGVSFLVDVNPYGSF